MNWFSNKKVLVPVDFSKASYEAIDTALEIASTVDHVCVVHIAPDLAVASPEVVWDTHTDEVRRKNIEKSFRDHFTDDKYRGLQFSVCFGDAGHGIADYAQQTGVDLIVMPSHGRSGLSRLLIGSVTERVMRLAHCPVLVLRN